MDSPAPLCELIHKESSRLHKETLLSLKNLSPTVMLLNNTVFVQCCRTHSNHSRNVSQANLYFLFRRCKYKRNDTLHQRWSPQGHILKHLALKRTSPRKCPVCGSRTALLFDSWKRKITKENLTLTSVSSSIFLFFRDRLKLRRKCAFPAR